jgi:hypothetical protein
MLMAELYCGNRSLQDTRQYPMRWLRIRAAAPTSNHWSCARNRCRPCTRCRATQYPEGDMQNSPIVLLRCQKHQLSGTMQQQEHWRWLKSVLNLVPWLHITHEPGAQHTIAKQQHRSERPSTTCLTEEINLDVAPTALAPRRHDLDSARRRRQEQLLCEGRKGLGRPRRHWWRAWRARRLHKYTQVRRSSPSHGKADFCGTKRCESGSSKV